jgi:hypothetical protein
MIKIKRITFFYGLFRAYDNGIIESAIKAFLFLFTKVYLKPRRVSGGIIP